MKNILYHFLFGYSLSLLFFVFAQESPTTLQLTLLSTTDLHCAVLSYDYYKDREDPSFGFERTSTLIQQARKEYPHTLLFDSGDTIQGNPLSDYKAWIKPVKPQEIHPIYKAMNALGYDAAAIGNHEFNYGLDFLVQVTAQAQFPCILSNVYSLQTKQPFFPPYVMLEKTFGSHTLKIGVIGFTPPQIMRWDRAHLLNRVYVEDIVKSAEKYVPEMRQKGADLIIALAHCGLTLDPYTDKMEQASYYLAQVEGIDAVLFGHSHGRFPGDGRFEGCQEQGIDNQLGLIKNKPAVMAGFWGNTLGLVHLSLEKKGGVWNVKNAKSELRPVLSPTKESVAVDPKIRELIHEEHEETRAYVNTPVCESELRIETYFSHILDSNALQMVNDAQINYVQKALQGTPFESIPVLASMAPFKTNFRGTGYTDILPGGVAIKHIADLYVYPNVLHAVKIDGTILKGWLEKSAHIFNQIDPENIADQELISNQLPGYNHDVIDGVTYLVDISQPTGQRILDLKYQGKPVTAEMEFIVATSNYRANGGGGFPGLDGTKTIFISPDTIQQILIEYFKQQKKITTSMAADKNWAFKPLQLKGRLLFSTAIGVSSLVQQSPEIQWVQDDQTTALYQVVWK